MRQTRLRWGACPNAQSHVWETHMENTLHSYGHGYQLQLVISMGLYIL